MAKLVFPASEVKLLYEHAKGAAEHAPTPDMLSKRDYLKAGVKLKRGVPGHPEDMDLKKVPAHLKLVRQSANYFLMSSGLPRLTVASGDDLRVMAEVTDGGEGVDGVEALPLAGFIEAFKANAKSVIVVISAARTAVRWS